MVMTRSTHGGGAMGSALATLVTYAGLVGFVMPALDHKKVVDDLARDLVALPREEVHAYGEAIPLQPGMLLSADIVFDRRSLVRWLFDPLFAVSRRT